VEAKAATRRNGSGPRSSRPSLSALALVLAVIGGGTISHMLQSWYAKIFRAEVHGWKAMARRVEWLAGVFGFVALQVVIGRRIQPLGGPIAAAGVQFLLALAFCWVLLSNWVPPSGPQQAAAPTTTLPGDTNTPRLT
jgi:hypothetical protein